MKGKEKIQMIKRICDFLGGVPMTLTGGIFVIISFVLSRSGIQFAIDPAWVTVIICGVPFLALSVVLSSNMAPIAMIKATSPAANKSPIIIAAKYPLHY